MEASAASFPVGRDVRQGPPGRPSVARELDLQQRIKKPQSAEPSGEAPRATERSEGAQPVAKNKKRKIIKKKERKAYCTGS